MMSLLEESNDLNPTPLPISRNDDFLIREIILTHDPGESYQLDDCQMLLSLVETTFCCITATENVFDPRNIDLIGSSEEPISRTIYKISNEIHFQCQCHEDANLHKKTLVLLELLGHYRWDAKVVIALASYACSFASFWLILQLQSDNALAESLALVKQLPRAILKPKFKALSLLVNTMLKLSKIIVQFEGVSLHHELVDVRAMDSSRAKIYMANYWIFRSILVCSSQFPDLRSNLSLETSDRTVIAAWGLHSLGKKLDSLCCALEQDFENCQHQIETRLYEKLLHVLKEKQDDNQKALRSLFASQNECPFNNAYSRDKIGILELKSKTVLLLISNPDLLPLYKTLFLVQQTKTEENCVLIWLPIASTNEWSLVDRTNFEFFSKHLPWLSVRKPWQLNSAVVNFIKQEWSFKQDPIMVALNEQGLVANSDAMDMVWIWGSKAFPFSTSRETHLWEEANWSIDLIINGIISPALMSEYVKEGRNLCIYGSDNIHWIKEFNQTIKKIKTIAGTHLDVVYVGCKNPDENVKNIINTIDQENLTTCLTFNNIQLFWIRLEAIKRSIGRHRGTSNGEEIAARVSELLEMNGGWAVIGGGSSNDAIKLNQEELRECIGRLCLWSNSVAEMGLIGAIRAANGGGKCLHDEEIPYEEGLIEKMMICGACRRPIQKFVVYKCDE